MKELSAIVDSTI